MTLSKKPITCNSRVYLVIDILCNVFGGSTVAQALKSQKYAQDFKKNNPNLVLDTWNTLSYQWQQGKAKEYLESLALDLQHTMICHLIDEMGE